MATTISLQNSVNWATTFVGFKQLAIGTSQEPVVTSGNIIMQTILAPPFSWNWNRGSATINATAGTQDYATAAASFGFIEKASYQIPAATITNTALTAGVATYLATNTFKVGDLVTVTGSTNGSGVFNITNQPVNTVSGSQFTVLTNSNNVGAAGDTGTAIVGTTTEISQVANVLGTGSESGSPNQIAPQIDDNAGNITFRILPVPDRAYTVTVIFQKKIPALMTSTSSTWAPIPDHYSYIYQWGFLALMQAYNYDVRWAQSSQKFVAALLGAAEGLSEEQKNVFQRAWLDTITEQQTRSQEATQGVQSRQT